MKTHYFIPKELVTSAKNIEKVRHQMLAYGVAMSFIIEECEDHRKVDNEGKNGCICKKCVFLRTAKELEMI